MKKFILFVVLIMSFNIFALGIEGSYLGSSDKGNCTVSIRAYESRTKVVVLSSGISIRASFETVHIQDAWAQLANEEVSTVTVDDDGDLTGIWGLNTLTLESEFEDLGLTSVTLTKDYTNLWGIYKTKEISCRIEQEL